MGKSHDTVVAHPLDTRALVAVDLGAESCRVSLLRWLDGGPQIQLVHRFGNGPVTDEDGSLRWPLQQILLGVDEGMRIAASLAPEGICSVAVDGWAVDYVRVDADLRPLESPFCYRDERTVRSERELHACLSAEKLRQITGIQLQQLNTLYQLYADSLAELSTGDQWLNLPEFLLARWGGKPVSEMTNASHTQMLALEGRSWSWEILEAARIKPSTMPSLVPPGTRLGVLRGPLADLPAFRDTQLIAPACHDTASAVAGIPAAGKNWGYISSGTWSLVGTLLDCPCNTFAAATEGFTNLAAPGDRILFHKSINGMWLLKQCMDTWGQVNRRWDLDVLCALAELAPPPSSLLDVDDPDLLRMGDMPARINAQLRRNGFEPIDESSSAAPGMASLIFHSLAAQYAYVFNRIEELTGEPMNRIFVVGGGSKNAFLLRLTAAACGREVIAGAAESSTIGNFAVQLAVLDDRRDANPQEFRSAISHYAGLLAIAISRN